MILLITLHCIIFCANGRKRLNENILINNIVNCNRSLVKHYNTEFKYMIIGITFRKKFETF